MFLYIFLLFRLSFAVGMESGIIGGKEAKPHSRPYLASLQNNGNHTCGGVLIQNNYVLTSAHCLTTNGYTGQNQLEVVLGAHNINKTEKSQQRIHVKQYIPHPLFVQNNRNNYTYDIMLLKLKTKAKLNQFVKVMPLPKDNKKTPAAAECSIAGWGIKNINDQQPSSVLQEVTLKVQCSCECEKMWQYEFSSERNICIVSDGKRAFCRGDSGSPLICKSTLVGIAAYTYPKDCTNKEYPEVSVKVSAFLPWIKKNIK